jgi:hypothetical protein
LWACLLVIALGYAYYLIFSQKLGDDEGYLMISLRGFLDGHPLYDDVFTQYGPAYYLYEWLVRAITTLPLTHDSTRLLCAFHWMAASLLLGAAASLLTRSWLAGAFAFMQGVIHLAAIANEPGHPQEIVAPLLALAMCCVARPEYHPASFRTTCLWLGVIGALLALIKVNVGAFYCYALFLALRYQASDPFSRRVWVYLLIGVSAAAPFLLMSRHLSEPWCRNYSLLAAMEIITSLVLSHALSRKRPLDWGVYLQAAAGFLVACLIIVGLTLWRGSSVSGLVDGLLRTPLRMPGVALLPMALPNVVLVNAGLGQAAAFLALLRWRRWSSALALLKLLYGVVGSLVLVGSVQEQFAYLLPWAWLVLIPTAEPAADARETFPRTFLCLASVWQGLQGYPIAGTQITLATLLLVLVFTLCLDDSFRVLRTTSIMVGQWARLNRRAASMLPVLTGVALVYLFANWWCTPVAWRRLYQSLTPLDLPGSARIHLPAADVEVYRTLSDYLRNACDTFITYPGYNSFYFWAGKPPPTQLNSTGWGQLTETQQLHILNSLAKSPRPVIVVHEYMVRSWQREVPEPIHVLVEYLRNKCHQDRQLGPYVIYLPNRG